MEVGDWITLGAVIVALGLGVGSIVQTQKLQKRERRERLLNEIIEWGIEFTRLSKGELARDAVKAIISENYKEYRLLYRAHIHDVIDDLVGKSGRSLYIKKITSKFDDDLQEYVKKTIDSLGVYIGFLWEWRNSLGEDIVKNIDNIQEKNNEKAIKAGEYMGQLITCAHKVIEEATKIKTKDIS